ncbi:MAG: roadblock/LC7 domain-containing protein [Candidatus Hodarchaeota archaeon]
MSDRGGGLLELLQDFSNDTGISACAIVSRDGLVMASNLPKTGFEEDTVAANAARILFLGESTGNELTKGELRQVLLKYDQGSVVLAGAGPYAAVLAVTTEEERIESGAMLFAINILAKKVKKLLEG